MSSLSVAQVESAPKKHTLSALFTTQRALIVAPLLVLPALLLPLAPTQLLLVAGLYGAGLIATRLHRCAKLQETWRQLCARSNARWVDLDAEVSVEGRAARPRAAQILLTDRGLYLATLSRSPLGVLYRDVRIMHGEAVPGVPEELRSQLMEPPRWEQGALLLRVLDRPGQPGEASAALLRVCSSDPRALQSRLPERLAG